MPISKSRTLIKNTIGNLFESYNVPHRLESSADTKQRVSFVRGIYNIFRGEGIEAPSNLTDEQAFELSFKNRFFVAKQLKYMLVNEKDLVIKAKVEQSKEMEIEKKLIKYGSYENFPLADYYMERCDANRLLSGFFQKALFMNAEEQPDLIIDCGYKNQSMRMKKLLNDQLLFVHSFMKQTQSPLKITFTSIDDALQLPQAILDYTNTPLYDATSKDISSLKCQKNLVYLTPHSQKQLTHISKKCTYIIGGIVDIHDNTPYSLSRARMFNAQTACLPLDTFFKWSQGSKSLTIDQVVKIMITLWQTHNWYEALSFVPRRKAMPRERLMNLKSPNMSYCKYVAYQSNFSDDDVYHENNKRIRIFNRKQTSAN